jgi:hypothetical protein
MEDHRGPSGGPHPGLGHLQDLGIGVRADDLALRAGQLGQQQGDVTGATGDVQDLIPGMMPATVRNWRMNGP